MHRELCAFKNIILFVRRFVSEISVRLSNFYNAFVFRKPQ